MNNHKKPKHRKKQKGVKPLQAKDYVSYINSVRWSKRRRAYFAKHDNICAICGSKERLNLHHKTYERLGTERDDDLIPLCGDHHDEFHEWHGKSAKDMIEATDQFIAFKVADMEQAAFLASL